MRIVHAAVEMGPWAKTGGLGDVAGALPRAQARLDGGGHTVLALAPLHRAIRQALGKRKERIEDTGVTVRVPLGGSVLEGRVWRLLRKSGDAGPDAVFCFVDCPLFFDRDGLYDGPDRHSWPDNALRFAWFSRAVIEASARLLSGPPDVLHAHDWHTALLPVYARMHYGDALRQTACVYTIHNLAYQGVFGKELLPVLHLDWWMFDPDRMEYYERINYMKGGIAAADVVTAVSPSYAAEIQTPEFGQTLEQFVRSRAYKVLGIVNGIDTDEWNPATDKHIPARYDAENLEGKGACRAALCKEFGIHAEVGEPVLGVVSRFVGMKGLDLVAEIAPLLFAVGARLVVLGSGEPDLEQRFRYLGELYSQHVAVKVGFDNALAHRITAGSDIFLVPSRFEPCGLTQIQAMRYGAVPVVHAVGGLRDTVVDPGDERLLMGEGTGFRFEHPSAQGLLWALQRAVGCYRWAPEGWGRLMRAGMRRDWSWGPSAERYLELYRRVRASRG
jgi:starch synthase